MSADTDTRTDLSVIPVIPVNDDIRCMAEKHHH